MLDKTDYILVELLGRDNPQVKSLLQAESNPAMRPAVSKLLKSLAYQRGINPDDPPAFGFADDLQGGDLTLGRLKVGDNLLQRVGLAGKGRSPGHTLICGQTETGKTTLAQYMAIQAIRRGDIIIVLARDHEWRNVLLLFPAEVLLYMEVSDVKINPLEVPEGVDGKPAMSPLEWLIHLKTLFRSTVFIRDVSSNMLSRVLIDLYTRKGVFQGSGVYPNLEEFRGSVRTLSVGSGKRLGEAKDSLLDRIGMIIEFLGAGLNVSRSRNVHKLFSHSIIVNATPLDEVPYQFLFGLLTTLLKAAFPPGD